MKCEECGTYIVKDNIELSCPTCGLVHGFITENSLPDRHRDNNNLGSFVGKEKGSFKMRRLIMTNSISKEERAMKKVRFYTSIVVSEFSLSNSTRETINVYYKRLKKERIFTSRMGIEERVAALGYLTLREYNYNYTLLEVSNKLEIPSKKISKLARLFARKLGKSFIFSTTNVFSLLEKFCLKLNKNREFINECVNLFTYLEKIETHYPTSSYLAGIVHVVETTQPHKITTQKEIAEIFSITPWTIRENTKRILSKLQIKSTFGLTINDIIEDIR